MARVPWGHGIISQEEEKGACKNVQKRLTMTAYALGFFLLLHLITTKNDTGLTDYRKNNKVESRTKGTLKTVSVAVTQVSPGKKEELQQNQPPPKQPDEGEENYHIEIFESFEDDEINSDLDAVRATIDDITRQLIEEADEIVRALMQKSLYLEINEIVNDVVDDNFKSQLLDNAATKTDGELLSDDDLQLLVDDIQMNVIEFCEEQIHEHVDILLENFNQTIEALAAEGQDNNMNAIDIDEMLLDWEKEIHETFGTEIAGVVENFLTSKATDQAFADEDVTAIEEYTANKAIEIFNAKFIEIGRPELAVQVRDYELVSENTMAEASSNNMVRTSTEN